MNRTFKLILIAAGIALLAFLFGRFTGSTAPAESSALAEPETTETAPSVWTCSMHPQVRQPAPGDCPICGMDLIPLIDDAEDLGERAMSMSESAKALADIQTTEAVRAFPEVELRLVGKLDYDATRLSSLTARFPARVEKLFVNYDGIQVKRGDHLAEIYSPELLSAQREFLTAHRSGPNGMLVATAREKLLLWDVLPEQIDALLKSGAVSDRFELRAPIGGIVIEKMVKEGDYVNTGEPLFRIADLSQLWLWLEAYESDLSWLRFGQEVNFTVEAYPGETFTGKVTFISPELDRKTRTVPIRVQVSNEQGRLKPGMFARGTIFSRIAEDGNVSAPDFSGKWISPMHPEIVKDGPGQCDVCGMDLVPAEDLGYGALKPEDAPIVVPLSAVLRTGKRAVVYVEKPNTERPTYEGREIVLGPRAGEVFIVQSGLEAGERVVTNGAFKIDSALQIQAKPSMMSAAADEPQSEGSMDAHTHIAVEAELLTKLLPVYFELRTALAADDLAASKKALQSFMAITGHTGALAHLIHKAMAAEELDGIRRPYFETLSNAMVAAVKAHPETLGNPVYLMHCPMVYPDHGADWLQATDELRNPYFGDAMLTCGEVKQKIGD